MRPQVMKFFLPTLIHFKMNCRKSTEKLLTSTRKNPPPLKNYNPPYLSTKILFSPMKFWIPPPSPKSLTATLTQVLELLFRIKTKKRNLFVNGKAKFASVWPILKAVNPTCWRRKKLSPQKLLPWIFLISTTHWKTLPSLTVIAFPKTELKKSSAINLWPCPEFLPSFKQNAKTSRIKLSS